jgi:DNA-binding transcriptional ArsR family regulator
MIDPSNIMVDAKRDVALIERLFSSRALYRTLALFFDYPLDPLNPRLISRYTKTDIKTVVIVLRRLEEAGLICGRPAGKYRFYVLDGRHPLLEELRSIFAKTRVERESLWKKHAFMKADTP